MPQQSRYQDKDFEALMNKVILTLEQEGADRDLSLMVLGNVITHIMNTQIPASKRKQFADQFTSILNKSINE